MPSLRKSLNVDEDRDQSRSTGTPLPSSWLGSSKRPRNQHQSSGLQTSGILLHQARSISIIDSGGVTRPSVSEGYHHTEHVADLVSISMRSGDFQMLVWTHLDARGAWREMLTGLSAVVLLSLPQKGQVYAWIDMCAQGYSIEV